MVGTSLPTVSALAAVVLAASTNAHNMMTTPLQTFPEGFYNGNSPSGTIDPTSAMPPLEGMSYAADGVSNTEAYWAAFNASTYKTLKDLLWDTQVLVDGATNDCGYGQKDGTPQGLPDMVEWDGFGHPGPCEVWCDDVRVFQNWNCQISFPAAPARLPYDKAKCAGTAVLTSYWLALHTAPWQGYTGCASIAGGAAGGSGTNSSTPAAATPATTPDTSTDTAVPTTAPTTPPSAPTTAPTSAPTTPTDTATPAATPTEANPTEQTDTTTDDKGDADTGNAATPTTPSVDKCAVRRRRY